MKMTAKEGIIIPMSNVRELIRLKERLDEAAATVSG
jgi:hypothetical protein